MAGSAATWARGRSSRDRTVRPAFTSAPSSTLGAVSAIGLLLLVLISLGQVGRILRLPYERWLFLHRLTGLLLLSALLHGWFLDLVINGSTPLLAIYVTMATIGMTAYTYDELVLRHREPRADYTIHRVERPTPDILDLTLTPTGGTTLPVTGGQFVYLRVGGWHEHPFSVAGTQADGSVRLTIRPWAAVHAASTRT